MKCHKSLIFTVRSNHFSSVCSHVFSCTHSGKFIAIQRVQMNVTIRMSEAISPMAYTYTSSAYAKVAQFINTTFCLQVTIILFFSIT